VEEKMDIKSFATEHGLQDKDIINLVKYWHPKYDKYLHSKVKRPDDYGIKLLDSVEKMLRETITSPVPRRTDKRRKPCRVHVRLSKHDFKALQQCQKRDGYDTMQAEVSKIIKDYLKERLNHGLV
jgi:hypothetical protein